MRNLWVSVAALAAATACGEVTEKRPDARPSNDTLVSITVAPAAIDLLKVRTSQLMATGTFGDGSTKDLTGTVTWASSNPTIATINGRTIRAASAGTTNVTAVQDGVTGMAAVTVPALTSLVVSSYSNGGVDFFTPTVNGDMVPTRSIRGMATTLVNPRGVAIIGQEIFVADQGSAAVAVFPLGGNGNITPTRRIVGAATLLSQPSGITAFNNEIYVASQNGTFVTVFPATANGNVAPARTIAGSNTTLGLAIGILVHNNELYVSDYRSPYGIAVFPITANGNVTPTRRISGTATLLNQPQGLAVDGNELFVSQGGGGNGGSVLVLDVGANGDVPPLRVISGGNTKLGFPDQIAIVGNELYVANYAGGTTPMSGVSVYPLSAMGDVAPVRFIGGGATQIAGTLGMLMY